MELPRAVPVLERRPQGRFCPPPNATGIDVANEIPWCKEGLHGNGFCSNLIRTCGVGAIRVGGAEVRSHSSPAAPLGLILPAKKEPTSGRDKRSKQRCSSFSSCGCSERATTSAPPRDYYTATKIDRSTSIEQKGRDKSHSSRKANQHHKLNNGTLQGTRRVRDNTELLPLPSKARGRAPHEG